MDFKQLPIVTASLRIRRFILQDAAAAFALSNEEAARKWLPSQVYRDHDHALSAIEFLVSQYADPGDPRRGPCVLAVEHRADSTLIGHVGFSPLENEVEIGFAVAQKYQGQGLATEAIVAGSRWAFRTFALDRILGIASVTNIASRRSLARARFAYGGNRRMLFQGEEQEVAVYALTGDSVRA